MLTPYNGLSTCFPTYYGKIQKSNFSLTFDVLQGWFAIIARVPDHMLHNDVTISKMFPLGSFCTVFQAEVYVIIACNYEIIQLRIHKRF